MTASARSATGWRTAGFFALVADLYLQQPTTQPDEAQQRIMALSMDRADADVLAAAEYLVALDRHAGERVGALGFCLGEGLAIWLPRRAR